MKISEFSSENFQFLVVKFSVYLNRRVFVMHATFTLSHFNMNKFTEPRAFYSCKSKLLSDAYPCTAFSQLDK